MKPASSKSKGRRLQQWVRDVILEMIPKLEPDDCKSTSMGASGEDIQLSPAARKILPVSIECKSRKAISLYKDYEQARRNAPPKTEPVVIIKQNRHEPLAVVDARYLLKLIKDSK